MTRPDCLECLHLYHCELCEGCGPGMPLFVPRDAYDHYSPRPSRTPAPTKERREGSAARGPHPAPSGHLPRARGRHYDSEERQT